MLISFLTHILKPGTRWTDTPTVILGHHHLSHRELPDLLRGDPTRVYVQELCSYDPQEEPVPCKKYAQSGHNDVAKWLVQVVPIAHARIRKEGLVGAGQPYLEVQFNGETSLHLGRHDERYAITLPSLILTSPLDEECALDFDGKASVACPATGLRAQLRFKAWRGALVAGEVVRLGGDNEQRVARIEGNWDSQVYVYSTESEASGVLFDDNDYPPPLPVPLAVNLKNPGSRMTSKLWSAIIEALLYTDRDEALNSGKKAGELVLALQTHLNGALLYEASKDAVAKPPEHDDEEAVLAAKDGRPLPPSCRVERAKGRVLRYQLQYLVQSLSGHPVIRDRGGRLTLPAPEDLDRARAFARAQSSVGASVGSTAGSGSRAN
jgi:hypothetical protein